jgi:hypothetical protein
METDMTTRPQFQLFFSSAHPEELDPLVLAALCRNNLTEGHSVIGGAGPSMAANSVQLLARG